MLEKFESQVAEYEIRMGGVAKEQGLEILMCHTILDRNTGSILTGSHTTIPDRPSNAMASMMQVSQLYNSLPQDA